MSSFITEAVNKSTGESVQVWCLDDYFGKHKYGYSVKGADPMREDEFCKLYDTKPTKP